MDKIVIDRTINHFKEKFGKDQEIIVLSPGRINIIGEHIDYNDGFVLPAAIDKAICFAFAKNNTNTSNIVAYDLKDEFEIDLNNEIQLSKKTWNNYILGVFKQLQDNGFEFSGVDCVFSSNIPIGSGLSSSAALECGFLFGIQSLFNLEISKKDRALMSQKAEHWVGINCGIMDQFASVFGIENKVIKLDCNTLEYEYYNADFKEYSLVLLDSNVKHSLFTSAYNKRREECENGLAIITENFPEIKSYRDCSEEQLLSIKDKIDPTTFTRIHFVVKEIARVNQACEALNAGNIEQLGQLLFDTHDGLSTEYEVSCEELDFLVTLAKKEEFVIGSRMMGGGFGGCAITLIKKGKETEIKDRFSKLYKDKWNIDLKTYDVKIGNGTTLYKA